MENLVSYVEIDINSCGHKYGKGLCNAVVGVTGDQKCFNTRNLSQDCQDKINFLPSVKTLRFAKPSNKLHKNVDYIPSLESVSITSPRVKPGVSLGERYTASVSFRNHPHGAAGVDPYYSERNYVPYQQGTFWGRFRAGNPFIKGQSARIIQGDATKPFEELETHNLIIDNFQGPNVGGKFSFSFVDMFRFLDNDKAKAPVVSNGYLSAPIDNTETIVTLSPAGIGEEYPLVGIASIGKEAVTFTRVGDVFTLSRGKLNTEEKEHEQEDIFQLALEYTPQTVDLIVGDLIQKYTKMDNENLPLEEWRAEIESFIPFNYGAVVLKPTGVRSLINELIEQAGLVIWPDVISNKVRLKALRPVPSTAKEITDDVIMGGTLSPKDQQDKRISSVWTRYNQLNPMEKLDEVTNFSAGLATPGANSDQYKNSSIKDVYSRWFPSFGRAAAEIFNAMILSRYESPPRMFNFDLPRSFDIQLGQSAFLSSWVLEEADGSGSRVPVQVVGLSRLADRLKIVAEEMLFVDQSALDLGVVVIDFDATDINLREIYDEIYSRFPDSNEVTFIVADGVWLGSSRFVGGGVFAPAITDGEWPVEINITLICRGNIVGHGGNGLVSLNGGIALKITRPITIDNTGGRIAGGGGAGGSVSYTLSPTVDGLQAMMPGAGGAGSRPGKSIAASVIAIDPETGSFIQEYTQAEDGTRELGGKGMLLEYGINETSGDGGDLGQAGTASTSGNAGGLPGNAVEGDSFITWIDQGTILGALT
jgi:hypothetical protein